MAPFEAGAIAIFGATRTPTSVQHGPHVEENGVNDHVEQQGAKAPRKSCICRRWIHGPLTYQANRRAVTDDRTRNQRVRLRLSAALGRVIAGHLDEILVGVSEVNRLNWTRGSRSGDRPFEDRHFTADQMRDHLVQGIRGY